MSSYIETYALSYPHDNSELHVAIKLCKKALDTGKRLDIYQPEGVDDGHYVVLK